MPGKRRFLVTGASGFIGRHAVTELLNKGHEVVALSRSEQNSDEKILTLRCDLLSGADLWPVVERTQADTLLHFAWETRHGYYWDAAENLDWLAASTRLIRAFREAGGRRVVAAGTCAEYEAPPNALCEALSTPCIPKHLYAVAKDSLRRTVEIYARNVGLSFAWARVFHLAGPGEFEGRMVPAAIRAFAEGRRFDVRNPYKRLDIIDVRDCGRGFAAIGESGIEGPINIGSGTLTPVADIVGGLAELLGRPDLVATGFGSGADHRDSLSDRCAGLAELDKVGFRPIYRLGDTLRAAIASSAHFAAN
jgi:nucleoside-diphosphate-sugar epimerase